MSNKISTEGETGNSTNHDLKGPSSSSPTVPILNIPRPTSSSISPNQMVSSSNDAAAHNKAIDEPEVMVLDDDEDMDQEVLVKHFDQNIYEQIDNFSSHHYHSLHCSCYILLSYRQTVMGMVESMTRLVVLVLMTGNLGWEVAN